MVDNGDGTIVLVAFYGRKQAPSQWGKFVTGAPIHMRCIGVHILAVSGQFIDKEKQATLFFKHVITVVTGWRLNENAISSIAVVVPFSLVVHLQSVGFPPVEGSMKIISRGIIEIFACADGFPHFLLGVVFFKQLFSVGHQTVAELPAVPQFHTVLIGLNMPPAHKRCIGEVGTIDNIAFNIEYAVGA